MTTDADRRDPGQGAQVPRDADVFPYLVFKEFIAAVLVSVGLLVWSLAVDAPLLPEASPGRTENPAKAPWYFVGLQELLVYFDPWIAGVAIPTLIIVGLMVIPYVDPNRAGTGAYTWRPRRLMVGHFLFGFGLWWVLIAIGQFLRGANWQFVWPWQVAVAHTQTEKLWSFPWWVGLPLVAVYFGVGLWFPRRRWPSLYEQLGRRRYAVVMVFTLLLYGVPLKMLLRLVFGVKYVLPTPWFNV